MTHGSQAGDGTKIETGPRGPVLSTRVDETIAAIATPGGSGGIGIVRISGAQAIAIAKKIFIPRLAKKAGEPPSGFAFKSHHLHYGTIVEPQEGYQLDEVLLACMPAPHSYTREDVIEIQCHGGSIILRNILQLVLQNGAKLAEPGEFTRRAYLNGRIDLSQAEAVVELINASSQNALKLAARQLCGGLKDRIGSLVKRLREIMADLEAQMEFGEDGDMDLSEIGDALNILEVHVLPQMHAILNGYEAGRIIREGIRLAIVGRPNVGKSSLLNRLIETEKAIVSPLPGTTRDPVEAIACINGIAVEIIDTAGLHESHDPVERIGIQKAREAMQGADTTLMVIDAQSPADPEDLKILEEIKTQEVIMVANKIDLVQATKEIKFHEAYDNYTQVLVSAKTGEGIDKLKKSLAAHWEKEGGAETNGVLINTVRHKLAMEYAIVDTEHAVQALREGQYSDMIAMDLSHAVEQLLRITGEGVGEEVLDRIFQKFCIGK